MDNCVFLNVLSPNLITFYLFNIIQIEKFYKNRHHRCDEQLKDNTFSILLCQRRTRILNGVNRKVHNPVKFNRNQDIG